MRISIWSSFYLCGYLSQAWVEVTRVLPEDFGSANHLGTYSSIYEKVEPTMAFMLEQLPSEPSPSGLGDLNYEKKCYAYNIFTILSQ